MDQENNTRTRNRGFASMDAHRQKEIARKGGRAAHEKGKAHEFTSDEARAAGRKGGEKVSLNRRHMAEIGRRGGRSSAQRRRPGSTSGQSESTHTSPESGQPLAAEHHQQQPAANLQPGHTQPGHMQSVQDENSGTQPSM